MRRAPIFGGLLLYNAPGVWPGASRSARCTTTTPTRTRSSFRSSWRSSPYAEAFARGLDEEFTPRVTAANLQPTLDDLGRRLALAIMRPEVVALRRLLIGESREFPALGAKYFNRAPGQVLEALASGFDHLGRVGLLRVADARIAAAQFAYLVVGELLNRAMLAGTTPPREHVHRLRAGRRADVPGSISGCAGRPREKGMRRRIVERLAIARLARCRLSSL